MMKDIEASNMHGSTAVARQRDAAIMQDDDDIVQSTTTPGRTAASERLLQVLTGVYVLLLIALFVWPRQVARRHPSEDGLGDIANAVGAVLFIGSAMLVIAIWASCVARGTWPQLSKPMKAIALFPLITFVILIMALMILAAVGRRRNSDTTSSSNSCDTTSSLSCPDSKND